MCIVSLALDKQLTRKELAMPCVTIWRNSYVVPDELAITLRDTLNELVASVLKVKLTEVTIRIRDFGPLDLNYREIEVELDMGSGKNDWREDARFTVAAMLAMQLGESGILPKWWMSTRSPTIWVRTFKSAFVAVSHPELAK